MSSLPPGAYNYVLQRKAKEAQAANSLEADAWSRFLHALRTVVGDNFLPSAWGAVVNFNWALEPLQATRNLQLHSIAGNQPLWSPTFASSTIDSSLSYELFLSTIFFAANNHELEAAIAAATNQLNILSAAHQQAFMNHITSFNEMNDFMVLAGLPPFDLDEYEAQFGNPSLVLRLQVEKQKQVVNDLTRQITSGPAAIINEARDAIRNPNNQMDVAVNPRITRPALRITPDPITIQQIWSALPPNAPPAIQFTISNSTSNDSSWNVFARGGSSFGRFFAVYTRSSFHETVINTSSSSFHLSFSARGIQSYSVFRPWYNGALVSHYRNGPFHGKPAPFWGPQGTFNILVTDVVVVYRPRITMRLSSSEYSSFRRNWTANSGVAIGPFRFGSQTAGGSESNTTVNDSLFEITTEVISQTPVVLGVSAHALNYP